MVGFLALGAGPVAPVSTGITAQLVLFPKVHLVLGNSEAYRSLPSGRLHEIAILDKVPRHFVLPSPVEPRAPPIPPAGRRWESWRSKMSSRLQQIQSADGSWTGHHCITSPVFCTAAGVQRLTADRGL